MKTAQNSVVTKHNDLISKEANFRLSELRLIAYCLAHYDSRKSENRSFTGNVKDLTSIFPNMDKYSAYAVVRKTMLELNKKPIEFKQGNKKYYWNWFTDFVYTEGKGEFEFHLNPAMR